MVKKCFLIKKVIKNCQKNVFGQKSFFPVNNFKKSHKKGQKIETVFQTSRKNGQQILLFFQTSQTMVKKVIKMVKKVIKRSKNRKSFPKKL